MMTSTTLASMQGRADLRSRDRLALAARGRDDYRDRAVCASTARSIRSSRDFHGRLHDRGATRHKHHQPGVRALKEASLRMSITGDIRTSDELKGLKDKKFQNWNRCEQAAAAIVSRAASAERTASGFSTARKRP